MSRKPFPFDFLPPIGGYHPYPTTAEIFILYDEHLYGDGPPQWVEGRSKRPCQSAAEANKERLRQIKRLQRFGSQNHRALSIANRLDGCAPKNRCRSGACPECARAWQRWFTTATQEFLAHITEAGTQNTILSPVHEAGIVQPGELSS